MERRRDPRPWQIGVLSTLLAWGSLTLDFEVDVLRTAATLAAALISQWACSRLWRVPRFDPRSPLISGLSLALLLRADAFWPLPLAAVIAIASKFAIRRGDKHVFNPTCFAIVVMLACADGVWVSAGQWGTDAFFAFAAAGLGMLVVHRAERSDVTWVFLAAWSALLLGRASWLGDPLAIPLHGLQSGALLLFAFFMISDPRTLPDARAGRMLYACGIAALTLVLQFGFYQSNPLLWALAGGATLVPLIDRLLPGPRHEWATQKLPNPRALTHPISAKENSMNPRIRRGAFATGLALALALLPRSDAQAFCGFYVAKADTKLFNKASQVVLVRDGNRTVITMSNDFQGDPKEFAMVIPVPTFVEREQIHVGDRALVEHLDADTAPRLVEYHDGDPCTPVRKLSRAWFAAPMLGDAAAIRERARAEGVRIEASYSVGEYDILILSASQSDGLARWLRNSGYRLPEGAERVLSSYLKQGMRFFVAKVNLEAQSKLGFSYLRPLQVAYESPKFMLPIRLGTLNANGSQELFVYTLTRKGRVETTNYRTVKLPTGMDLPTYLKDDFGEFYKSLFDQQVVREDMRVVFTEYAWDMAWCDPCAADPLSRQELRDLGVFWVEPGAGPAPDVFVTRLHLRYDAERFPADLVFQQTGDRSNFQGRYVLRHPFAGPASCPAAEPYRQQVAQRQEHEAQTLASLTGWDLMEIRRRIGLGGNGTPADAAQRWWQRLWLD